MNTYEAAQKKNGRWDYTCSNGYTYPLGYCAGLRLWTEETCRGIVHLSGDDLKEWIRTENARLSKFESKYHRDGHPTKEQAELCYREYLLDNSLRFLMAKDLGRAPEQLNKCVECDAYTANFCEIRNWMQWNLCDAHANREVVERLFKTPGYVVSSY